VTLASYWHSAPRRLRATIQKRGLRPDRRGGFLYLFETRAGAASWDYPDGDVWRVQTDEIVEADPHPDAGPDMVRIRRSFGPDEVELEGPAGGLGRRQREENPRRRTPKRKPVALIKPQLRLVQIEDVDPGDYESLLYDLIGNMGYSHDQILNVLQTPMPIRSCPVPGGIAAQAQHEHWRGAPANGGQWWDYRDDEFMERMKAGILGGVELPPIVLLYGSLLDGYHRMLANLSLGRHEIDCVKLEEWISRSGVGDPAYPPSPYAAAPVSRLYAPNPQEGP